VRLLYASRAVDPSAEAIETILAKSRQYNPTCGIAAAPPRPGRDQRL